VLLLVVTALPASGQSWRTLAKARQLRGQDRLEVNIEYAVGELEVSKGPSALLYRFESKYDEDIFELQSNYLESEGRGILRIDIAGENDIDIKRMRDYDDEAGNLELALSPMIPVELNVKMGAAKARLDLGGVRLSGLTLQTGASDTEVRFSRANPEVAESCIFKAGAASVKIRQLGNSNCRRISVSGGVGAIDLDFSGDWTDDASADINVGLGGIELRVPAELGVRIEKNTFLMTFEAPGFEKQAGGVYLSRNWDTADRKLTINISGALGRISVARS
jgi:hypothetical protein